jgi:hypothetical protein
MDLDGDLVGDVGAIFLYYWSIVAIFFRRSDFVGNLAGDVGAKFCTNVASEQKNPGKCSGNCYGANPHSNCSKKKF